MKKRRIILASTSPRRKELLEQIGLDFEIMPSAYEEDMHMKMSNARLSEVLAYGKAVDVAKKVQDGVVIGSDTFVTYNGVRMGKPINKKEAVKMLQTISGQWVTIYSGIAIIDTKTKREYIAHEITKVKIKKLVQKEIVTYIKTGEPLDKAGAFAIQGRGATFIEKISGCHTNVIGLPLHRLYLGLQKLDIAV
ncbi:MAG: Maf family protein [Parcubacteria group bacterium]|jgi:septum formation protein